MEFFTQEIWLLPNWAWFAVFLGVACVIIAVIIVACVLSIKAKNKNGATAVTESEAQSGEESKQEEVKEEKVEKTAEEEKPAEKKAAKKTSSKKEEEKSEPKKEEKPAEKATPKKEEPKNESSSNENKVYHISKRKEDGKWQVKAEGANKALRLFFTQADAIQYAKKVAGNQEGRIVVHKEGGGFRKLNY